MRKFTAFFALIFCVMSMQAARTFVDFEIDLTKDPVVLPDGVTGSGASFNGAQHGWVDYTITFKVDGPVKMTFGGCQYANKQATVTSKTGTVLATVDTKTPGCYHNGGVATWTYNGTDADEFTVYLGEYCPYFKAEAVNAVSNYIITYFDQNGNKLGEESVDANATFAPAYTEANLTIAEGYAFRGWKKADGTKLNAGAAIESNYELYASVTEVEVAAPGKTFTYDLAQATWYQDEHELITITNGAYHSNHGWHIKPNGTIELAVAGNATVQVKNCAYSDEADITVTTKEGAEVATFPAKVATDGDVASFEYEGAATTLVLTMAKQAYIHGVTVINKAAEEPAPGAGSDIEMKLYSTNFQDWEDIASSTTASTKTVTTSGTNETLTFTLAEVQVDADGTNSKHTAEFITPGYAMAAKTATPYIETSVLKNVTKVTYVHAATGGSRGWGLLVKAVDAEKWDTIHSDYCVQAGSQVEVPVNRENVVLRWYNLNGAQNAYMTEMAIYGNVHRAFTNFEIDMSNGSDYDPAVVPSNVTITGTYRKDSHGYDNFMAVIPVDGPVKFTIGGCQYSGTPAVIKNQAGDVLASLDVATPGCYHNGGVVTWLYNVEQADVLTLVGAQYTPYLKVEACAFVPNFTITYYDQNGTELGKQTQSPGDKFTPAYNESNLTIPEGYAFRGWTNLSGVKISEGTIVDGDMKVYASISEIEVAETGKYYTYDMTLASWYDEDHECIAITNGAYYNNHGWKLTAGGTIELAVSEKAYIQVKNCAYSAEANIEATVKSTGNTISSFSALASSDGAATTFFYSGAPDTIVLTMGDQAYIHGVSIYNVSEKVEKSEAGYYVVPAGDAGALLLTLMQLQKGDKVFLPNGVYDLGEAVLTQISVDSVSIIGESMEGTIIRNAPDASTESINNTATILLTGNYVYFQDLTLKNELDYYKANNGRAVTLQDKATGTICKNVQLLSYQDTYYSNKIGAVRYFEDGSIHGTVDYICGDGSVYFNGVELYCEPRKQDGSGEDCITASNADASDKGYVFESCVIKSECPIVSLSRSWNNSPQVVYLNTTLDYSAGNFALYKEKDGVISINRWTITGMNNSLPTIFGEYNTMDVEGNVISPASHVLTFKGAADKEMETILSAEQAANFSYAKFFGSWDPAADAKQMELAYVVDDNGNLTWDVTEATLFLVTLNGECEMTASLPAQMIEGMTVRAANGRGGFGPAAVDKNASTDLVQTTLSEDVAVKRIENGQLVIIYKGVKYNALGTVIK